jgi:histone H2A
MPTKKGAKKTLVKENKVRPKSKSSKAGLQFPVEKLHKYLKDGRYGNKIGKCAPVFVAAVLEYLTAEVLELAGNVARDHKKSRISPRHIMVAVRNDEELNDLLSNITISSAGVVPHIHRAILGKKKAESKKESEEHPQEEQTL